MLVANPMVWKMLEARLKATRASMTLFENYSKIIRKGFNDRPTGRSGAGVAILKEKKGPEVWNGKAFCTV